MAEPRYRESAVAFQALKSAVQRRRSRRVFDYEIGEILGLSPTETSHIKAGRRRLRRTSESGELDQLGIDTDFLATFAAGSCELEPTRDGCSIKYAWTPEERTEMIDQIKRASPDPQVVRRRICELNEPDYRLAEAWIQRLLSLSKVVRPPVHIPDLWNVIGQVGPKEVEEVQQLEGQPEFKYTPKQRIRIACAIVAAVQDQLDPAPLSDDLAPSWNPLRREIFTAQVASRLLVPGPFLVQMLEAQPQLMEDLTQMADRFWVPTPMIQARLCHLVIAGAQAVAWSEVTPLG